MIGSHAFFMPNFKRIGREPQGIKFMIMNNAPKESIREKILNDLKNRLISKYKKEKFHIGRTANIQDKEFHNREIESPPLIYTLEIANGNNIEISELRDFLQQQLSNIDNTIFDKDPELIDTNNQELYIAFSIDEDGDELYEHSEKHFLGENYPIQIL